MFVYAKCASGLFKISYFFSGRRRLRHHPLHLLQPLLNPPRHQGFVAGKTISAALRLLHFATGESSMSGQVGVVGEGVGCFLMLKILEFLLLL